ncbi:TetR/AcrR family transcriptional regulator [Sediminicola luteus]|uniref:TetR family transcriptional regulator n=1 Tax=Sediminicola luteus TaxID=319238 RepID=A0A2A4G6X9_9FLAO|nr:TetR/AcrR family transcriptional regulator [Sediminicola luteus]PCE63738.1 TetR family transcriptional regulator [Sediminicola luteus]
MKKDRAATEEKIYQAFLKVLEERGPQGVGINAIAKTAGVSKELIYRYFGGLKGLLLQYAQKGDFFKTILDIDQEQEGSLDALKIFTQKGTKELRENALSQEILRWQLLENNEHTKDLFKFTNAQIGKAFPMNGKDTSLTQALNLMIGGYVYFTLLSKFNKYFINTDLSDEATWEKFDSVIARTIELFKEGEV